MPLNERKKGREGGNREGEGPLFNILGDEGPFGLFFLLQLLFQRFQAVGRRVAQTSSVQLIVPDTRGGTQFRGPEGFLKPVSGPGIQPLA